MQNHVNIRGTKLSGDEKGVPLYHEKLKYFKVSGFYSKLLNEDLNTTADNWN